MAGPNTRDERGACLNLFLGVGRIFPNPDAAGEGQADRQQSALRYPGLLAGVAVIPATLRDLTTIWSILYQPAVHVAHASGSGYDDTTLVRRDLDANVKAYDGEDDLNTAAAKYIEGTY